MLASFSILWRKKVRGDDEEGESDGVKGKGWKGFLGKIQLRWNEKAASCVCVLDKKNK